MFEIVILTIVKKLGKSLFLYFNHLVSVTAGGPDSLRGRM